MEFTLHINYPGKGHDEIVGLNEDLQEIRQLEEQFRRRANAKAPRQEPSQSLVGTWREPGWRRVAGGGGRR